MVEYFVLPHDQNKTLMFKVTVLENYYFIFSSLLCFGLFLFCPR